MVEKYLAPLMDEYLEIVKKFANEYIKLFPKHLKMKLLDGLEMYSLVYLIRFIIMVKTTILLIRL